MIEKGHTINVLDYGYVRYIDHMGTDNRILEAARISYKSPSKGDEKDRKLLEYLWKNKHTSPFEMAKITFNIKLPIFVMRQFVRTRMQNLNELSARYTELPSEFYIPTQWRKQDTKNKQGSVADSFSKEENDCLHKSFVDLCKQSYKLYEEMLNKGVAKEMARMTLPVNIYTEIYSCFDLRNLLHFIELRKDCHAQVEIQQYAIVMEKIAKELFPWTLEAFNKYKFVMQENDIS